MKHLCDSCDRYRDDRCSEGLFPRMVSTDTLTKYDRESNSIVSCALYVKKVSKHTESLKTSNFEDIVGNRGGCGGISERLFEGGRDDIIE